MSLLWWSYLCTGTCSQASSSSSLHSDPSSAPGAVPYSLLNKGVLTQTSTCHLWDLVEESIQSHLQENTLLALSHTRTGRITIINILPLTSTSAIHPGNWETALWQHPNSSSSSSSGYNPTVPIFWCNCRWIWSKSKSHCCPVTFYTCSYLKRPHESHKEPSQ